MNEAERKALRDAGIPIDGYNLAKLEADIQSVQPRFFDVWVIPPLMMWFATKAKEMPRNARRMLFAGGIYAFYRNYSRYKKAVTKLASASGIKQGATEDQRAESQQFSGACFYE